MHNKKRSSIIEQFNDLEIWYFFFIFIFMINLRKFMSESFEGWVVQFFRVQAALIKYI